jgi:hypothetical protein
MYTHDNNYSVAWFSVSSYHNDCVETIVNSVVWTCIRNIPETSTHAAVTGTERKTRRGRQIMPPLCVHFGGLLKIENIQSLNTVTVWEVL